MTRVNLLYLLCQCSSLTELETMARELGCIEIRQLYGAVHMRLPDGQSGSFRVAHVRCGDQFVWCAADSAE